MDPQFNGGGAVGAEFRPDLQAGLDENGDDANRGPWTPNVSVGCGGCLPAPRPSLIQHRDKKPTRHIVCCYAQEDNVLRAAVTTQGARNWTKIAEMIPGRSGKSCRLRWVGVGVGATVFGG